MMNKTESKEMYIIDVQALDKGPWSVSSPLSREWMESVLGNCEYKLTPADGTCSLKAQSVADGVLIRGEVALKAKTECCVCLDEVTIDIRAGIETYMKPAPSAGPINDDLTEEDLEYEWYEGNEIVLDGLVGDAVLLELPMNPRCTTQCRVLEYLVTADEAARREKPIDPRLQALADPGLRRRVKSGSSKEENI